MEKAPLTGTQFGESEYGQRLSYEKPKYRDVLFGIAYYVHLAVVIGAGAWLWITQYPDINDDNDSWQSEISLTGIFVGVFGCMIAGICFGLFWLQIMKRFASTIIKSMLFLNIGCWVAVALIGFVVGQIALVVIGLIFAAIYALYTWCIWRRIPFSSALLSVSSSITSTYGGTVLLSLMVILFNAIWIFIWGSCASAYFIVVDQPSDFVIFLLLVSFYWAFQVNQNISHTTTCGVTASWYFSTELNYNPTPPAFKRTMTTSFGSVAFGSLLVAIIQALRQMVRMAQNNKNQLISCIAICLLNCLESIIRFINKFAFAHCAIYGTSFVQSARQTFDLFASRGIQALINDDLTGLAIFAGALIGGIVSAGVGYLLGYIFYNGNDNSDISTGVPIGLAIYGFFIGLLFCMTVLYVVHSSIVCLFVCYCEDPATLSENRPEEYQRIANVKPEFQAICNQYGGGRGNAQPRQQQQQQQQQGQQGYNDGNMYGNNSNRFAV